MDHICEWYSSRFGIFEYFIEWLLRGEIRYNDKIDLILPRRMRLGDVVGLGLRPHRGRDSVSPLFTLLIWGSIPIEREFCTSSKIESICEATKPFAPVRRTC